MVPREVWYKGFQREVRSTPAIELKISPELLETVYLNIKFFHSRHRLHFRDRWCFCWPGTAENVQIRTKSAPEKTSPPPTTKSSGETRNGVLRGLHGSYLYGKIKVWRSGLVFAPWGRFFRSPKTRFLALFRDFEHEKKTHRHRSPKAQGSSPKVFYVSSRCPTPTEKYNFPGPSSFS